MSARAGSWIVAVVLALVCADTRAQPVINEVNAGEGGIKPGPAPFIELYNNTQSPMPLTGLTLASTAVTETIALDDIELAPGAFWVLCGTTGTPVPACDQMSADLPALAAATNLEISGGSSVTFEVAQNGPPDDPARSRVTTGLFPDGGFQPSLFYGLMCPTPGAANVAGLGSCGVVINEVDYDQGATDDARFIELGVYDERNLACYDLAFADTNGATTHFVFPETTPTVAAGELLVLCDDKSRTPGCALAFSESQPDDACGTAASTPVLSDAGAHGIAIRERSAEPVIDSLSYGGVVAGYTEGASPAPSDLPSSSAGATSTGRLPGLVDTDDNGADFTPACATPGAANAADLSACQPPDMPPETDIFARGSGGCFGCTTTGGAPLEPTFVVIGLAVMNRRRRRRARSRS